MVLIVGLGNPGTKYKKNRHNAGFMLVDKLKEAWNFPAFVFDKKLEAEMSKNKLEVENSKLEVVLAKPRTFMNNSGISIKKLLNYYKLTPVNLIVVHDDLDIELGKFKISTNSRSAGHNGVQNIIDTLGTQKFRRFRIGVEGNKRREVRTVSGKKFVIGNFTSSEEKILSNSYNEAISFIQKYLHKINKTKEY